MEDVSQIKAELESAAAEVGAAKSLNDLPDKCLIPMLKNIPMRNMDDVSMVCQRWDKLIQEHVPLEIWATDVGFRIAQRFFDDLANIDKYTIGDLKSRVTEERFPQLKSPKFLETLELASPTTVGNLRTLTNQTVNLKELHFAYGSLTLQDLSSVHLDLPNLQLLDIMDRSFENKCKQTPEIMENNVVGLLKNHFPSIKAITLSTVATRKLSEKYGIEMLRFLQKNYSTIKKVKIDIGTAIDRNPMEDYGSLDHSIVLDGETSKSLNWNQLSKVRFEDLDIDFGLRYFVGMEEWRKVLSTQDSLVNLNLSLGKPLPPLVSMPAVTLSTETLVSIQLGLEINRSDQPLKPLDCRVFEPCKNLKMLVLIGNVLHENDPRSQELINTSNLPKSLEAVGIENILMVEEEIRLLFLHTPLKKVALENVGCEGEFGMTLHLLTNILEFLRITEIIIKGINGDECQLHNYNVLTNLGLRLPLKTCTFHVTFFAHREEYMWAGEC